MVDEISKVLTGLENQVAADVQARILGGRSGESPKRTHARAVAALLAVYAADQDKTRTKLIAALGVPDDLDREFSSNYLRDALSAAINEAYRQ